MEPLTMSALELAVAMNRQTESFDMTRTIS